MGVSLRARVLVGSAVNLYLPGFTIDALVAKNLIYFFGHVFVNATIYMAIIAVYEIIPEYTGRAWKTSRWSSTWTLETKRLAMVAMKQVYMWAEKRLPLEHWMRSLAMISR